MNLHDRRIDHGIENPLEDIGIAPVVQATKSGALNVMDFPFGQSKVPLP